MDAEQREFLKKQVEVAIKRQPKLAALRDRLLEVGGEAVCFAGYEEDLDMILKRGTLHTSPVICREMRQSKCHFNVAMLWNDTNGKIKIVTGYALSKDGVWRQHTWGCQSDVVIETTELRTHYCGFKLNKAESGKFFYENM